MVDLVRSGRIPEALSREFEPTAQAIWKAGESSSQRTRLAQCHLERPLGSPLLLSRVHWVWPELVVEAKS
jgi:hypothetical protein